MFLQPASLFGDFCRMCHTDPQGSDCEELFLTGDHSLNCDKDVLVIRSIYLTPCSEAGSCFSFAEVKATNLTSRSYMSAKMFP